MTTLALWHGWGMHPTIWNALDTHWSPNIKPSAQALPGYAGTPTLSPYSLEKTVDALLKDQPSSFVLCGWSLGAMAAMLAAARHPDRISHLVLISATPSFVKRPNWPDAIEETMLKQLADAVEQDSKIALKRFMVMMNQKDIHGSRIARELAATISTEAQPSPEVLKAGLELLRLIDLRAIASTIQQPTLIIHGAHDPLMPISAGEWLRTTIPNARLEIFADAAHTPHLSDPARCAGLITDFIHA